ncbi:hypothetical protein [Nocardioides pakistanensis]
MGTFLQRRAAALAGAAASALLLGVASSPATADEVGTTLNVTVSGDPGLLSISVGQSAVSGEATAGGSVEFDLGAVTVTDTNNTIRATSPWTVAVRAEDLTHASEPGLTIPASNLTYLGTLPSVSGVTLLGVEGMAAWTTGMVMATVNQAILQPTAALGSNSASWNAKVTVNIPGGTTAGSYTGTVFHSVA